MKRILTSLAAALILFTGCSAKNTDSRIIENSDGSVNITRIDEDGKAILFNKKYGDSKNVTQINLAKTSRSNPVTVDLSAYEGKDLEVLLSCEMLVEDKSTEKTQIIWMINELD